MTRRLRGCAGMAAPAVMVWLTAVPVAAQAPVVAADGATGWTAARTPWGDPDLQGTFTNNNENGIPLERPDDFEARRLEDVTPEELARLRAEREERRVEVAPRLGVLPGSNPIHWFEHFGAANSRAWLVVDPPDGKVPPLTPETTNVKEGAAYRGANADRLRLVERFTPVSANTLEWAVTIDDPTTWTAPWTFAMHLTRGGPEVQPFEYACHEGNYGLENMLRAARAGEQGP